MGILLRESGAGHAGQPAPTDWAGLPDDTVFFWGAAPAAEAAATQGRLSLRAAFGGRLSHVLGDTELGVDDDAYLLVNPGATLALRGRSAQPAQALSVHFSPATLERCLAASGSAPASEPAALFSAHLRLHDRRVTPLLRALIADAERDGTPLSRAHWEAHAELLLQTLLAERERERERISALAHARVRTRQEIYERVSRATDYLLSHFDQPVNLQQLADVAGLAKFHFLRMFVAVHRLTPMEYLRCKRVAVASRLLHVDGVALGVVARQVGVADRSTLLRLFIDYRATTPDQYRRALRASVAALSEDSLLGDLVASRAAAKASGNEAVGALGERRAQPLEALLEASAD